MFTVGIDEIDEQHKILIGIINQLHHALKTNKDKTVLSQIFKELVDYTHYHFDYEHTLMDDYNYPNYQIHRLEHEYFTTKILKFQSDFENNDTEITSAFMEFLKQWLVHHIMQVDKQLGNSIRNSINESI